MSKYTCKYCGRKFDKAISMTNHRRWHKVKKYKAFQVLNIEKRKKSMIGKNKEEKNGKWVGNKVGYFGVHNWIRRKKIKPILCERCKKNKPYELANLSGKYKRDVNDYEWICRSCHSKEHNRINNLRRND